MEETKKSLEYMNAVRIIIAVRYFLFFSYFLLKKIASFLVNHLELLPGIYVSRKDTI
jgi:type III secretory pathway component EscU